MLRSGARIAVLSAAVSLAACAGTQSSGDTAALEIKPAAGAAEAAAASGLGLSAEEREFDCKKLTGRMQIRILEARSYGGQSTSALARSLHAASASMTGGTAGLDPKVRYAADRGKLEVYNRELAAKNCRSYDLPQALAGTDVPPVPTVEPKKSPAN